MKPIRLIFILLLTFSCKAFAGGSDAWELICLKDSKSCQSLWIETHLPSGNGKLFVAYNVTLDRKKHLHPGFVVSIEGAKLHPNVETIIVYTNKDTVRSIPIAARDATGVTAEFDNAVTINKLLEEIRHAEKLSVSFMEEGAVENTTIAIPLDGFEDKLESMPHGEDLFQSPSGS